MSRKRFPWGRVFFILAAFYIVGWMLIPAIKYAITH